MKINIIRLLAATVSLSMLASCNLDLYPISAVAYDEDATLIENKTNLSAIENGILSSYRGLQNGDNMIVEELMFNGFNATVDFGNNYGAIHKTDYNFTSSDYDVEDFWSGSYTAIKNFNIAIANTAEDKLDESLVKDAKVVQGEAYFFRAATYLQLARHFGKAYSKANESTPCVPLVLAYDQNELPARATVGEVYAAIKADLDQAATLLAGVAGAARSIKPTIDAVNALYARYYLDVQDYSNAASYAHKVIDTKKYTLASTAEEMEDVYIYDKGSEAIYQGAIKMSEFTGNTITAFTLENTDSQYGIVFRPYYLPSKTLIDLYDEDDLRLKKWFDDTTAVALSGNYFNTDKDNPDFYVFTKYRGNWDLTTSEVNLNGRSAPKPFKISEMYLIAAEAELQSGNSNAAKADLNAIQIARGATTSDATMTNVQNEWFKETVGEGLRLSCMKRWGTGFNGRPNQTGADNIVQQGDAFLSKNFAKDDYHFQWPIPAHEMNINKNLVQNEGF
ncbi:MAG: RagB/SusD family nutrient uptake outer membrane protein [Bacteroidales bacterium]|nr:RagB/SusD family nutrient uptake outer membrane protein [Bacteroidales bacterium]